MTPPDDPPKKPPRASWEAQDPDEPVTPPPVPAPRWQDPISATWKPPESPQPAAPAASSAPEPQNPEPPSAAPVGWEQTLETPPAWKPDAMSETPSIVVEPAMTSASMIAPASPASSMVDDPRLPTLPPAPPVVVTAKRERKKSPPPELDDPDDDDVDDDGAPKRRRSGKLVLVVASTMVLGLGIATLVFLGNRNKERLLLACEPQQVIAKQGRGFPPWGERNIEDDGMWKPIKIPPEAECTPRETDDEAELSRWYLQILVDRASTALTAKEGAQHGSKEVDEAFTMLEQALLHTRAPDRREQRREIERLLGDVGYWRASAKLKDAAGALGDAAKQFDAAAAQRPRHVSDASAWATYVRKLAEDLKAGPNGAATSFPPTPPSSKEPAPPGVALPVEPPKAGSGSADPVAPVDAGMPTGGVLL